jgi:hypothetical protein
MVADKYCARFLALQPSKDLCGLAIKSVAELHIARNWLWPPIAFDVSVLSNVAHDFWECGDMSSL